MANTWKNIYRSQAILNNYKTKLSKTFPELTNESGIYFILREEGNFKFAYIGQAKNCLNRLAQHLKDYKQHIDRSLKKHGLFDEITNPNGWKINMLTFAENELDEKERYYIELYGTHGYQLYNQTLGGQDSGKFGLKENEGGKGYREGVDYGYKKCLREIREYFDKYLDYTMKEPIYNKSGKPKAIKVKKLDEFRDLMKGGENGKKSM